VLGITPRHDQRPSDDQWDSHATPVNAPDQAPLNGPDCAAKGYDRRAKPGEKNNGFAQASRHPEGFASTWPLRHVTTDMTPVRKPLVAPTLRHLPLLAVSSARAIIANPDENLRNFFWIRGRWLQWLRLLVYTFVAGFSLVKHHGRGEVWQDGKTVLIFSTCGKAPADAQQRWWRSLSIVGLFVVALIWLTLPLLVFDGVVRVTHPPTWARLTFAILMFATLYVPYLYVWLKICIRFVRRLGQFDNIQMEAVHGHWQLLLLITQPIAARRPEETEDYRICATATERRLLAALLEKARDAEDKGVYAFDLLVGDARSLDGLLERIDDPDIASWMPTLYQSHKPLPREAVVPRQLGPARWTKLVLGLTIQGLALLFLAAVSSVVVLSAEQGKCSTKPSPGCIRTFGQAFYWALTTMTTTGYGDFYPHTGVGRVFAILLMGFGVVAIGIIVSSVATVMMINFRRDERWAERLFNADPGESADTIELREIRELLRQLLRDRRAPNPDPDISAVNVRVRGEANDEEVTRL